MNKTLAIFGASASATTLLIACTLALPIHEGAPGASSDGAVAAPPPEAGQEGGSTAKLLFRSGFEQGVTLDNPTSTGGDSSNNFMQHLHGADDGGTEWPLTLWGTGRADMQLYVGFSVPAAGIGNVMQSDIVSTTARGGGTTRALYQQRKSGGNISYHFSAPDSGLSLATQGDLYIRHFMRLDAGWAGTLGPSGFRILFEILQVNGVVLELRLVGGKSTPEWLLGRFDRPGDPPTWEVTSAEHLPGSAWFKLELFFHPSAGGAGRAWAAIDGAMVVDRVGDDVLNDSPVEDLYLFMNEGAIPAEQWSDELEIWDGLPADAAPH